jgi:hypothetical protein
MIQSVVCARIAALWIQELTMNQDKPNSSLDQPAECQIRVRGYLDSSWSDWFDGLAVTSEPDGQTLLTGPVADQAALHGLIKKVRDLGLELVLVKWVEADDA